ncbi:PQQ-binding-like beta-propeller repeat protein [Paenibacillus sp. N3.4]|uniref:PQQ-binding-like beta-propeller repeat protein n=1 Tax=Paenibacillus sp. N3.4 TaxID=2603222 RepID=UPI0011CC45BF|nr:WD40 repeat domain-containing protein [Paenibacillus sp. N3.4]TXK72351.1 WD40 repeat domain-containing protein [Paenibacillus sp. N3.4]
MGRLSGVDPDSNDVRVLGIPVPRESIYGGILSNDERYYYFTGYMRGHFYRLDLETNEVKDFGKISEFASCRLIKDAKGRIYGGAYTGELWRFDPEKDVIEDLKVSFRSEFGNKYRRMLIFALNTPRDTMLFISNIDGDVIELDPETLETVRHGFVHLRPEQPRAPYLTHTIGGLAADENFVLYYGLESYHDAELMRLVRWDILGGGEPENLGLISPSGKQAYYICEMHFDRRGLLHMVEVCGEHSPYILAVDTKRVQVPGDDAPLAKIKPITLHNMHMNNDRIYDLHMEAEVISTFPLHRFVSWKNAKVKHMKEGTDGNVYGITGSDSVYLLQMNFECAEPLLFEELYAKGSPVSCIDGNDHTILVVTSDHRLLVVDLLKKACVRVIALENEKLNKIHCLIQEDKLLISDSDGKLYLFDPVESKTDELINISLQEAWSHLVKLNEDEIILSGWGDEILRYRVSTGHAEKLDVLSQAIKGRAFRSTITTSALLDDGTLVCGTFDGVLYTLSADRTSVICYGRLYSTGELRGLIRISGDRVAGIYGGTKDAGHVFAFSPREGFRDLGRPRVNKETESLKDIDSEWASIHYISCILHTAVGNRLYVASGEEFGCLIRYQDLII